MATFKERVESYIGTVTETSSLSTWLSDAAKIVVNLLPDKEALKYTVDDVVPPTGLDITNARIMSVVGTAGYAGDITVISDTIVERPLETPEDYHYISLDVSEVYLVYWDAALAKWDTVYPNRFELNDTIVISGTTNYNGTYTVAAIDGVAQVSFWGEPGTVAYAQEQTGEWALENYNVGYAANEINPAHEKRVITNTSLHYATELSPVWLVKNGKIYVHPGGGRVWYLAYPNILYSDSTVALPKYAYEIISLYAATQGIIKKVTTEIADISGTDYSGVTVPTAPLAPTFIYNDVASPIISTTDIDISSISVPTYTSPTLSLSDVVPDLVVSTFSGVTPTVPSVTYTDAVVGSYTNNTIGSLGSAPVYVIPSIPSGLDISNTSPSYTAIITDEDLEKGQTELARQKSLLEKFNLDIQNSLNSFNEQSISYQSTVQEAFKNAEIAHENLIKTGSDTTNVNIQNAIQNMNSIIQEYQLELGKHSADVDVYARTVQNEIATYSQNLGKNTNLRQSELQEYNAAMQDALNIFNKEVLIYKTNIEVAIQNASLLQQKLIKDADNTISVGLSNAAKQLESTIAEYASEIQRYSVQVQAYATEVNGSLGAFNAEINKLLGLIQPWLALYSTLKQQYLELLQVHLGVGGNK